MNYLTILFSYVDTYLSTSLTHLHSRVWSCILSFILIRTFFLFLLHFDIKYLCESTILYFVLVYFSSLTLISSLFLESCNDS